MRCDRCGKQMKEETLFTSIEYKCNCSEDGWQTSNEIRDLLKPMDFPVKLKFKDADGTNGAVLINDLGYFDRCPRDRKFKIQRLYDPYIGYEDDGS